MGSDDRERSDGPSGLPGATPELIYEFEFLVAHEGDHVALEISLDSERTLRFMLTPDAAEHLAEHLASHTPPGL